MYTVRSRVAQARSLCNCPACATTIFNGLTRRTGTATARRKVRVGDVFTVFASSLAATAAFIDSNKKDARTTHWNRVIAEARAQVEATEIQHQIRLARLSQTDGEDSEKEVGSLMLNAISREKWNGNTSQAGLSRPVHSTSDTWSEVFTWAAQQQEARATSGFRDWRGLRLDLLLSLSPIELQQLLSEDATIRRYYGGLDCAALTEEAPANGLSAKKLKTLEYSVAKLVLTLLQISAEDSPATSHEDGAPLPSDQVATGQLPTPLENNQRARAFSGSNTATSRTSTNHQRTSPGRQCLQSRLPEEDLQTRLADINSKLNFLKKQSRDRDPKFFERFKSPPTPRYCNSAMAEGRAPTDLNIALKQILESMHDNEDLYPAISKICLNLLSSKSAPNIYSYNMLLLRFCQLDKPRWVQAVQVSMRESHIRPNEITYVTLLRYFTIRGNSLGYVSYLLLMAGHNGGLAIAAPGQIIPSIAISRYQFFGRQGKAAEKARLNGEVYEAVIVGALRFFGSQAAMQCYRDMISEGWQASVTLLASVLGYYYYRCDWSAGVAIWGQIAAIAQGTIHSPHEIMLLLSQAYEQQKPFDKFLQEGIGQGLLPMSILDQPIWMADALWEPLYMSNYGGTNPNAGKLPHVSNGSRTKARRTIAVSRSSKPSSKTNPQSGFPHQLPLDLSPRTQRIDERLEALTPSISDLTAQVNVRQIRPNPLSAMRESMIRAISSEARQKRILSINPRERWRVDRKRKGFKMSREEKAWEDRKINLDNDAAIHRSEKASATDDNVIPLAVDLPNPHLSLVNIPHPTLWSNLDEQPLQLTVR